MHQAVCLSLIHLAVLMLFLWDFLLTSLLSAVTISHSNQQKKIAGWAWNKSSDWDSGWNVVSDMMIISPAIRKHDPASVTSNFLRFSQKTVRTLIFMQVYWWRPVACISHDFGWVPAHCILKVVGECVCALLLHHTYSWWQDQERVLTSNCLRNLANLTLLNESEGFQQNFCSRSVIKKKITIIHAIH